LSTHSIKAQYNRYAANQSSSYKANGKTFTITYGGQTSTKGYLSQDTLNWSGLIVKNQIFAEATQFPTGSTTIFDVRV